MTGKAPSPAPEIAQAKAKLKARLDAELTLQTGGNPPSGVADDRPTQAVREQARRELEDGTE